MRTKKLTPEERYYKAHKREIIAGIEHRIESLSQCERVTIDHSALADIREEKAYLSLYYTGLTGERYKH